VRAPGAGLRAMARADLARHPGANALYLVYDLAAAPLGPGRDC
jgi:hypothetical protein